ncbi:MAG TPA: hypothetical protein VF155_01030 [Candidatus Dormibacteraeota bacterium]
MAAQRWRRIFGKVVEAWMESSLALDPSAYAAAAQARYDRLEDAAITTYRNAAATARVAPPPAAANLRLDVLAG